MKVFKKLSAILLIAAVVLTTFSFSGNKINADAKEMANFTVYPGGFNYNGTNYTENVEKLAVASGSTVEIGYYALQSGWQIFGLEYLEATGTGTDLAYTAKLQGNYKVTLDAKAKVVYFRKVVPADHVHNLMWVQLQMPTYCHPEVDIYFCPGCHYVQQTRPAQVDTYKPFANANSTPEAVTTVTAALKNVKAGDSVTINLGYVNNVTSSDMDAIRKSNANVTLKFTCGSKKYTVTIPAGGCIDAGVAYYGPEFLRVAYNGTAE